MGVHIPDIDGDLEKKISQNVSKTFKSNSVDVHITGPFRNDMSRWRRWWRWRWCGGGGGIKKIFHFGIIVLSYIHRNLVCAKNVLIRNQYDPHTYIRT